MLWKYTKYQQNTSDSAADRRSGHEATNKDSAVLQRKPIETMLRYLGTQRKTLFTWETCVATDDNVVDEHPDDLSERSRRRAVPAAPELEIDTTDPPSEVTLQASDGSAHTALVYERMRILRNPFWIQNVVAAIKFQIWFLINSCHC